MDNNNLYRITEQDVHVIMENVLRRVLKEFYDKKNVAQLWDEAVSMLGSQEFAQIIEDNWEMDEIYTRLKDVTGMDDETLDAIDYDEFVNLMGQHLDLETQYEILKYIGEETGEFSVDDVTDAPVEKVIDVDSFDEMEPLEGGEISSEDEVEVDDDEEYEDPEFKGMNDLN